MVQILYIEQSLPQIQIVSNTSFIGFMNCTIANNAEIIGSYDGNGVENIYFSMSNIPINLFIKLLGKRTKSIYNSRCILENCTKGLIFDLVQKFKGIPELGIDFWFVSNKKSDENLHQYFRELISTTKNNCVNRMHVDHSFTSNANELILNIVKNCPNLIHFSMCCQGVWDKKLSLDKRIVYLILCAHKYDQKSYIYGNTFPIDLICQILSYNSEENSDHLWGHEFYKANNLFDKAIKKCVIDIHEHGITKYKPNTLIIE